MSHHRGRPDGYEARLAEHLEREVHPDTAKNIGDIMMRSPLASAELVMGIVVEMQQDPIRKDAELVHQGEVGGAVIRPLNFDGVIPDRHPIM